MPELDFVKRSYVIPNKGPKKEVVVQYVLKVTICKRYVWAFLVVVSDD
jgi:hypothetical protein